MFHIVLVEPQIPQNTGNIIRLCANTGAQLHLVEPMGFPLNHSKMRRAGLDYHEYTQLQHYQNWSIFLAKTQGIRSRMLAFTTRGQSNFGKFSFLANDWFIFGAETHGLAENVYNHIPLGNRLRLPMRAYSRSLNLSNSVAIVLYEAWRQQNFLSGV